MLRTIALVWLLGAVSSVQAWEQAPPAASDAVPGSELSRETLGKLYQTELGPLYKPELSERLLQAHGLIEKFFAERQANARKQIIQQIAASQLDANVLGRITRIRSNWQPLQPGIYYTNERVGPHAVSYFLGVPKGYDLTKAWPLVIKLPGAHAFVTDPKPTSDEVVQIYTGWVRDELSNHPDAVVLMPLLNLDELWGPSYTGMNNVIQPLHHVAGRLNIDPARVYIVGQGMSAHAAWNLAIHYPTYLAAINPLAGGMAGWQKIRIVNLRNVYCVVWHDADDQIVRVDLSRDIVRLLKQNNYNFVYEETKGVGHAPSDELADRLYKQMRTRTRELYPKEVVLASNRPDTLFNRSDWVQVFEQLAAGGEQRYRFQHGSGVVQMSDNSYRIAATLAGRNRIEVKSANVEAMRFYLNDQMVDFSKAVTVVVNGRVRFEGLVKQDLEAMLTDQVLLGRGWRYFSGYAEVDFGKTPATTAPVGR